MENDQLTANTVRLNEIEPEGFCDEPFILSNEVKALRAEVAAMREAILRLIDLLQQQSKPPSQETGEQNEKAALC
jgi:hypothetical protein